MTTVQSRPESSIPTQLAETFVEDPAIAKNNLDRAVATQNENQVVPSTQLEREFAKSPQVRAKEADQRIAKAVETATEHLSGVWVSGEDAMKAQQALAMVRPEDLERVLKALDTGLLDKMLDNLPAEGLVAFTRTLSTAKVFDWKPAINLSSNTSEPINLIEIRNSSQMPFALIALAHDLNNRIAQDHPQMKLKEPGPGGSELDLDTARIFNWGEGLASELKAMAVRTTSVLDINRSIAQLQPGESCKLTLDVSAMGGASGTPAVGAGAAANIEVIRTPDGKFLVSGDAAISLKFGIGVESPLAKASGEASLTANGKVTYALADAAEAGRLANALLVTTVAGGQLKGGLQEFESKISSVEGGLGVLGKFGLSTQKLMADAGIDQSMSGLCSVKLELKDGKPVAASLKVSTRAEWNAKVASSQFPKLSAAIGGSNRLDLEVRVPLDGSKTPPVATARLVMESKGSNTFANGANELEVVVKADSKTLARAMEQFSNGGSLAELLDLPDVTVTRREIQTRERSQRLDPAVPGLPKLGAGIKNAQKKLTRSETVTSAEKKDLLRSLGRALVAGEDHGTRPIERPHVMPRKRGS